MDALIAFVQHMPRETWAALAVMVFLPIAVLVLVGRVNDQRTIERDLEAYRRYAYRDPAHRVTQSPAAKPRVVRGSFRRPAADAHARVSDGLDGGTAA